MSKKYDIAVVGATGAVGEVMLSILKQRNFPVGNVYALASERSVGKKVAFGDQRHPGRLAGVEQHPPQVGVLADRGCSGEAFLVGS